MDVRAGRSASHAPAWSWRSTGPRARASRAPRAASRPGSGCATSTPARMYRAITWWMLRPRRRRRRPGRGRRPLRRARLVSPAPTRPPRRSPSTAPTSPCAIRTPEVTGARLARSAPCPRCAPACSASSAQIIDAAWRAAASSSRAATSARSSCPTPTVKVYLTADAVGPRRRVVPPRRAAPTSRRPRRRCSPATGSTPAGPRRPLTMADGAVHLDTTPYTLDEVVDQVVAPASRRRRVSERGPRRAGRCPDPPTWLPRTARRSTCALAGPASVRRTRARRGPRAAAAAR